MDLTQKQNLEDDEKGGSFEEAETAILSSMAIADQKRVLRKVDWRLVPLLSFLYLVSFIDRGNCTYIHSECCGKC